MIQQPIRIIKYMGPLVLILFVWLAVQNSKHMLRTYLEAEHGVLLDYERMSLGLSSDFELVISFEDGRVSYQGQSLDANKLSLYMTNLLGPAVSEVRGEGLNLKVSPHSLPVFASTASSNTLDLQQLKRVQVKNSTFEIQHVDGFKFKAGTIENLTLVVQEEGRYVVEGHLENILGQLSFTGSLDPINKELKGQLTGQELKIPLFWLDRDSKFSWPQLDDGDSYIPLKNFSTSMSLSQNHEETNLALADIVAQSQYFNIDEGQFEIGLWEKNFRYNLTLGQLSGHKDAILEALKETWLNSETQNWLKTRVECRNLSGSLRVRGNQDALDLLKINLDLEGAKVNFDDSWPMIENVQAKIEVDESSLTLKSRALEYLGFRAQEVSFTIPNFSDGRAKLATQIAGSVRTLNNFENTPLQDIMVLDDFLISGELTASLDLDLDLKTDQGPLVDISVNSTNLQLADESIYSLLGLDKKEQQVNIKWQSNGDDRKILGHLSNKVFLSFDNKGGDRRSAYGVISDVRGADQLVKPGRLMIALPKLKGEIGLFDIEKRITAKIDYLYFKNQSTGDVHQQTLPLANFLDAPSLAIYCRECIVDEVSLRNVTFESTRLETSYIIDKVSLSSDGLDLKASGALVRHGGQAVLKVGGISQIHDGGQAAKILDWDDKVGGFKGQISFSFTSRGENLSLRPSNIDLAINLENGYLRKTLNSPLIKLSQLLSLDILDLTKSDFVVSKFRANVKIDGDQISSQNVYIKTPSSRFRLHGGYNMRSHEMDAKLNVQLRVTNTIETLILGAVNPLYGLGYWGLSRDRNSYFDWGKRSSYFDWLLEHSYSLQGPLDDPSVQLMEYPIFGNAG